MGFNKTEPVELDLHKLSLNCFRKITEKKINEKPITRTNCIVGLFY